MSQVLDQDTATLLFDPEYQNNLFLIEEALQTTGVIPPAQEALPNIYDEQLRTLIDSVPLE